MKIPSDEIYLPPVGVPATLAALQASHGKEVQQQRARPRHTTLCQTRGRTLAVVAVRAVFGQLGLQQTPNLAAKAMQRPGEWPGLMTRFGDH